MSELVRLTGGQGTLVIVECVAPDSRAHKAGVRTGHALVALNGRNEFMQLPGWQVRLLLEAPITLTFESTPKISCSEIRIKRSDTLGLPSRVPVCGPRGSGILAEEVIFDHGAASMFISTKAETKEELRKPLPGTGATGKAGRPRVYELRPGEASQLVGIAMLKARSNVDKTRVPETREARRAPAGSHSPGRCPSPLQLCTGDVPQHRDEGLHHTDSRWRRRARWSSEGQSEIAREGFDVALGKTLLSKGVDWKYSGPESRASLPQRLGRAEFSRPVESIPSESETTSDTQCSSFFADRSPRGEHSRGDAHSPLRWLEPVLSPLFTWAGAPELFSPRASPSPSPGDTPTHRGGWRKLSPRPKMARGDVFETAAELVSDG